MMRAKPFNWRAHGGHEEYAFVGGYPTRETVQNAYDDADLNRAIQAYRFFFPTVSGLAIYEGNEASGLVPNQIFGILDTQPKHVTLTPISDTPYGPMLIDLRIGGMVVELPPGPLSGMAMDINQRWIGDIGLPGPDAGNGGAHLFLPPKFSGDVPPHHHVWHSTSNRLIIGVRSIPVDGDMRAAMDRLRAIDVRPVKTSTSWGEPRWINVTDRPQDTTPAKWESNIGFWEALHRAIDSEPPIEGYLNYYGELAALGIAKGRAFAPDNRMRDILQVAARIGNAQLRVQAFADRRPDRVVWPDRNWEWVGLRCENADFATPSYTDLDARETWFYQAVGASPAMFRRSEGVGSICWLTAHDHGGAYLDGAKTYRLAIPQPVPARLFWSVTVYDALSRSEIQTDQRRAALRSLFELRNEKDDSLSLYFGPKAASGAERRWIKTIPGRGWFAYFRIYGPESAAFDQSWKPGDFVAIRRDDTDLLIL
jgi:hypothetical protein